MSTIATERLTLKVTYNQVSSALAAHCAHRRVNASLNFCLFFLLLAFPIQSCTESLYVLSILFSSSSFFSGSLRSCTFHVYLLSAQFYFNVMNIVNLIFFLLCSFCLMSDLQFLTILRMFFVLSLP